MSKEKALKTAMLKSEYSAKFMLTNPIILEAMDIYAKEQVEERSKPLVEALEEAR